MQIYPLIFDEHAIRPDGAVVLVTTTASGKSSRKRINAVSQRREGRPPCSLSLTPRFQRIFLVPKPFATS